MTEITLIPGVTSDIPWAAPVGQARTVRGLNIRWRFGQLETLGLFGALRTLAGARLQVPLTGGQPIRALYTAQSSSGVQILAGALNRIDLIEVNPASIPGGETRYQTTQLGGALTPTATESLPNPSLKRILVQPIWWFAEQENVILGQRAGVNESVRFWTRDPTDGFDPVPAYAPGDTPGSPTTEAPKRAVAGAILNRIAILLGCTPEFATGAPGEELMVVRWSARNNFQVWDSTIVIDPVTGLANIAGSLQLDRGSRIVGGGFTSFGVIAWTDKAMAQIFETNDFTSVIGRVYVDGGRGLLSNRAWCDADGRVWWLDETRTLNVYDGGRPQQVPNPMRRGTIDRVTEVATSRIYMAANPENGEILIWYPSDGSNECDRAMVYNYLEDAWSIWGLNRTHWFGRQGAQEAVAVSLDGTIFAHDIGPACPNAYRPDAILPIGPGTCCGAGTGVGADNLDPISGFVEFGPMVLPDAAVASYNQRRVMMDWIAFPAIGATTDTVEVMFMGYENASVRDVRQTETHSWTQGQTVQDYRVGGRAISMQVQFTDIKTVFRLGMVDIAIGDSSGGER